MIVKQIDIGWQIIHQQAHGLLAFQLALCWKKRLRPSHWVETLIALTEHDDGQDVWAKRNHLTTAGAPLDFKILEYSVEQCRNMIRIGLEKSRWNALMLSMHTTFLYTAKRGQDKALDAFLDEQVKNQKTWREACLASQQEADYAYAFLQWCDALSLILCQDLMPPDGRRLEISKGPDGKPCFIFQQPQGQLSVDPWPFEQDAFTVHVEAYQVPQLSFASDEELYNAIHDCEVVQLMWEFAKGG